MSIDTDRRVRELEQRVASLEKQLKEMKNVAQQAQQDLSLTLKQRAVSAVSKAKQLMDSV
jgi:uncharacterized coiled-coil protein SlyX